MVLSIIFLFGWDQHYDVELENFRQTGDEGDVWFGRSAENRILKFLAENVSQSAAVIDFGCGNGSLLRKLHENGYMNLLGVDYSSNAIELAKKTSEQNRGSSESSVMFEQFDLISDGATNPNFCNRLMLLSKYKTKLKDVLKKPSLIDNAPEISTKGRYFILFSCNFTKDELVDLFGSDGSSFTQKSQLIVKCHLEGRVESLQQGLSSARNSDCYMCRVIC
uniref:Methyltransferase domain-containing protein n=1 Tax=Ditylenchus dipsaci TaxID=166011 RepID=A0A915DSE7_9BILA